ncbi:hypothetical protein [Methyloglobulus sp.]|uniref:hypothetical protein n=1 Tax=Methyloglobulus sp. TaxID=2518622 RepID=UPI0039890FC6
MASLLCADLPEIKAFAHQGFAILSDLLTEPELALARELVAGLVERHKTGIRPSSLKA